MTEIKVAKVEKEILLEFKAKLHERLGGLVEKVILFGSKARGDVHKESDIDILVVVKEKNNETENKIHNLLIQILLEHNIYLSVVVFSSREYLRLNNIPTVFMQNVARHGVTL